MATESHAIDPNGDVLLILRNSKPSFAVWDELRGYTSHLPDPASLVLVDEICITETALKKKGKGKREKSRALRDPPVPVPEPATELLGEPPPAPFNWLSTSWDEPLAPPAESPAAVHQTLVPLAEPLQPSDEPRAHHDDIPASMEKPPPVSECVEIRVSSHHLTLASSYYSRVLKGEWKEADTFRAKGSVELKVHDIDAEALLIVMKIIHSKTRTVPRAVTLEMLAKIAVIVDLYQFHEAVEVFTDMWVAHLRSDIPKVYSRDAVLWICISWVFRLHDEFHSATRAALRYSSGPIQDMGLPIPESVVGMRYSIVA